jgi:hypothetical protein
MKVIAILYHDASTNPPEVFPLTEHSMKTTAVKGLNCIGDHTGVELAKRLQFLLAYIPLKNHVHLISRTYNPMRPCATSADRRQTGSLVANREYTPLGFGKENPERETHKNPEFTCV